MNYTVVWLSGAEQELARLWLDEDLRPAVTIAANELDRRLAHAPNDEGESRPKNRRITFVPPLGVIFRIYEEDRFVRVLSVWLYE
jgi:hypothetical protein